MTPLEQAEALLKAAEEATRAPWIPSRDFERTWWVHAPEGEDKCPLHNGGRGIVESNTPTDNEENDIKFVALARNTAPAIASALLEKHQALEEAEKLIRALIYYGDIRPIDGVVSGAYGSHREVLNDARAFLARQGETA